MSRILTAALTCVLSLSGVLAVPTAQAADGAPGGVDVALPAHHRSPNVTTAISGATADYVLYDDYRQFGGALVLLRRSDGQVVRTVPRASGQPRPVLIDDVVVRTTSDQVVYEDVAGDVIRTLPRAGIFHADDSWVMGVDGDAVTVARFDGTSTTVSLPGFAADGTIGLRWVAGDSDGVLLTDQTRSWAVDLDAGTVEGLVDPDGAPVRVTDGAMAPTPVAYSYNPGHWVMRWSDPLHDPVATRYAAPAAAISATAVVGGRLVAFVDGSASSPFQVWAARPIDLASATLEDPLASDVTFRGNDPRTGASLPDGALTAGGVLPDGGLVVGRADVATGSLTSLELDGVHPVGRLAPVDDTVYGFWRSGPEIVGEFMNDPLGTLVIATLGEGDGDWADTLSLPFNRWVDQAGGGLVASGQTLYDLHGWSRDVGAYFTLSGNGRYITVGTDIEDARTGEVVLAPGVSGVIDGDTFYTQPDASGEVTASDLTGAAPDRTLGPVVCGDQRPYLTQVRGRYAIASCHGSGWNVVDLAGRVAAWPIPGTPVGLGSSFVVWTTPDGIRPTGAGFVTPHVTVLRRGHETREYTDTGDGAAYLRTDTAGDHDPLELGLDDGRIHALDVSWARAPDTVAPKVTADGSERLVPSVAATHVDYQATATDATDEPGDVTLEVQARRSVQGAAFGPWTAVANDAGAVHPYVRPGEQLCLRSRATDVAGNTSGWTGTRCYVVPVDDARLATTGDVVRARKAGYLGGTVSGLVGTKPTLLAPGRGSSLVLRLAHGARGGVLRVLVKGQVVATVVTHRGSGVQDDVVTGIPAGAGVRLAASGPRPVLVDAVARLR